MVNEGRLLLKLSVSSAIGSCTYLFCESRSPCSQSKSSYKDLVLYSCILFAYYVWFLTLVWWLPAGVRSIWIWPLQFEPRLITGLAALSAISVAAISTATRMGISKRIGFAMLGSVLWQVSGIYGKTLSVSEIALSEKITGYLGASRFFSSTNDIARSYGDRIGSLPFHVNTHPAGKVLLMKLLDQLGGFHAPSLWALLMVTAVCLIVPMSYKIARLLHVDRNKSALVASL